ncbi:uncharacterized protein ACMZJ9_009980 [Mantella aurantiaca]
MSQEPEITQELINLYTLGNTLDYSTHGFQRVAIQLFGFLGHGRSSLINSCVCVVKDEEYQNVAGAGMTEGALTIQRNEYELTNTLVIVDNRGFKTMKRTEIIEACAQIRSLRDIGEVSWDKDNLTETLQQFPRKYQNRPADFILPVMVYSATNVWNPSEAEDMQLFITQAFRITGIHPIVVITRCDVQNFDTIKQKFGELGVTKRLSVENYTENDYIRTEEKDRKILELVHVCVQEAERGIRMRGHQDNQTEFVTQAVKQIQLEIDLLKKELERQTPAVKKKGPCAQS